VVAVVGLTVLREAFMKTLGKGVLLSASALVSSVVIVPQPVMAQEAEAVEEQRGIKEIVVTARKVEESLSDAPVAVSVLTSEMISQQGLNSLDDFAKQATGISFSQAFGRTTDRPVIRGASNVLAGVQAGVETGAAFFIDGIYYQGDIQGFDPASIERVEIVKGPQSALYGRNTYAGAINYITKDPSEELAITGRLRAAQHNEYEIAGSVSGSILEDRLGIRVGGRYFKYGGEYRNQLTGKGVGQEETKSAYATLTFKPFDDFKMRSRISWQKDDDGPLALFLQGAAANNCKPGFRSPNYRTRSGAVPFAPAVLSSTNTNQFFCGVIKPQPNNVRLNTDPMPINIPAYPGIPFVFGATPAINGNFDGTAYDGITNEQLTMTNIIDWDLGGSGWILSSLTGWRDNKNFFGTDSDHSDAFAYFNANPSLAGGSTPNPLTTEPAFANTNRDDQQDFSQEIRIASPADAPLRVLAGLYYFKQKFRSQDITFASGTAGLGVGRDNSEYDTIEDKAIFGLVEYDLSDNFSITAEGRYAEEVKTQISRGAGGASVFCAGEANLLPVFGATGAGNICRPRAKFTGFDPRITVNYTTPGGTLLYGVFATGRKPGGFNGSAGVTATAQSSSGQNFINYLPEKSKGGEVGIKFDALDRTLRGSLSVFYNELTNVQLTQAIPNPSGTGALTSIVANSGNAKTEGFEFEFQAAPSDGLLLNLGIAYVNAEFTKGCDADLFILNSGGLRTNFDTGNPTPAGLALCDISGKKLPLGSPWIVNGGFNYETGIGSGDTKFFTLANFSYEDSKYIQTDNLAKTGDAFLLNARLGIKTENFTIALFGRNLTDEDAIPLATRWFDLRYGAGTRNLPPAPGPGQPVVVPFDGRPAQVETGSPRAFFGGLRKGRTLGVEATFNF
jgi:iron complex outermembrane recepter protein